MSVCDGQADRCTIAYNVKTRASCFVILKQATANVAHDIMYVRIMYRVLQVKYNPAFSAWSVISVCKLVTLCS